MAQSKLRAAIDAYVERIKNHDSISDPDVESLAALLEGNQTEIHVFETEMRKVRQPIIDELAQVVNEMPDMTRYNSDPESFLTDENRDRFDRSGIDKHTFVYKRTATWDWHPIEVGVLVPRSIDWNKDVGILVKWHGGAFVNTHTTPLLQAFCLIHKKGNFELGFRALVRRPLSPPCRIPKRHHRRP